MIQAERIKSYLSISNWIYRRGAPYDWLPVDNYIEVCTFLVNPLEQKKLEGERGRYKNKENRQRGIIRTVLYLQVIFFVCVNMEHARHLVFIPFATSTCSCNLCFSTRAVMSSTNNVLCCTGFVALSNYARLPDGSQTTSGLDVHRMKVNHTHRRKIGRGMSCSL